MRYLRNESLDPHYNMAFDEFCLQELESDEVLFYLWQNRPAVIIGLNQNAYAEVNIPYLEEKGIALARRVTGGGAVYHDLQNLNYTIVGKSSDIERDYPQYAGILAEALRSLGVPAELSGRNDIMVEGKKVSGYAKRVWKDRLMVHGTLMFNVDLEELTRALAVPGSKLESAGIESVRSRVGNLKNWLPQMDTIQDFQEALESILSRDHQDGELLLTRAQLARIESLADERFRSWDWVYGKSQHAAFHSAAKFACGNVEVTLSVEHGLIQNLQFGGDFLGNLPTEVLSKALEGCRLSKGDICSVLETLPVSQFFDRMTPEELAGLIADIK